jgi:hypothetical protein
MSKVDGMFLLFNRSMKKTTVSVIFLIISLTVSPCLFSQKDPLRKQFGISVGAFINPTFDLEKTGGAYVAFYRRIEKHEFSLGLIYPSHTQGRLSNDDIKPTFGALAAYKCYLLDPVRRENLFVYYSLHVLRYCGSYYYYTGSGGIHHAGETDTYINNIAGVGFNVFMDKEQRFSFYYSIGYVISYWMTEEDQSGFVLNALNSNAGFSFKLAPKGKRY